MTTKNAKEQEPISDNQARGRLIAKRAKLLAKQRSQVEFLAASNEVIVTGSTWDDEVEEIDTRD